MSARDGVDEVAGRPRQVGIGHLGLSVTDVTRSTNFYCDVLGARLIRAPHESADFAGQRSVVMVGAHAIDLSQFDSNDGSGFDPSRVGLDHVAFDVESPETLEAWAMWLDAHQVERSPIRAGGGGSLFDFVDPDGIQIEFYFVDVQRLAQSNLYSGVLDRGVSDRVPHASDK